MQPLIIYGGNNDLRSQYVDEYIKKLDGQILTTSEYFLLKPIKNKKSISIDQIRELLNQLCTKPVLSKYKVVVFDSADLITTEAQNAMLKTLEESPEYLLIIFCVQHYSQLISTIVSRCNLIDMADDVPSDPVKQQWFISITEILNMSAGSRIDWAFDNKIALAQKEIDIELVDYWLTEINDMCIKQLNVKYSYVSALANELFRCKKFLLMNANPLMVIESFLYTIE